MDVAVWLIAVVGTIMFGLMFKALETFLGKKRNVLEAAEEPHYLSAKGEAWNCEVFTTRLFEERLVDAGIMPLHDMTRCKDGSCKECYPPVFECKECLCLECLEERVGRREFRNSLTPNEQRAIMDKYSKRIADYGMPMLLTERDEPIVVDTYSGRAHRGSGRKCGYCGKPPHMPDGTHTYRPARPQPVLPDPSAPPTRRF